MPVVLEVVERKPVAGPAASAGLLWLAGQAGGIVVTGLLGAVERNPLARLMPARGGGAARGPDVVPSARPFGTGGTDRLKHLGAPSCSVKAPRATLAAASKRRNRDHPFGRGRSSSCLPTPPEVKAQNDGPELGNAHGGPGGSGSWSVGKRL